MQRAGVLAEVRLTRRYALAGLLLAACLPALAWWRVVADIAAEFRWDFAYLVTGWLGYALIAFGLVLFLPVVWSIGRDPAEPLVPRSPKAVAGWGTSLYLLGVGLAIQVQQLAHGISG